MPPELRALEADDLPRVVEIERYTFSDPWSAASFKEALTQTHLVGIGAFDSDGVLLGYAFASRAADQGEILNLAVAPDRRRCGVGTALLTSLLERLLASGTRSVYLEVRRSNRAAKDLYLGAGFQVLGHRLSYYRRPTEDALTMGLRLGPEAR